MGKFQYLAIFGLVLLLLCPGCAGPSKALPALPWNKSLPESVAAAQASDRPILVVVGATWCPHCRRLEEETLAHRAIRALMNDFVLLHVDVDEQPALAERFAADMLPTLVIMNSAGKVLLANVGFQDRDDFTHFLEQGTALVSRGEGTQPASIPPPSDEAGTS